jgi:HD-GYP domain-containing protein (c-di-GMP phosphodiesterase class II)
LIGEEIPLFAAIISIVDAYDAMTSERPYRKALSREEALQELIDLSGRQFNPRLIDTFISLIKNNDPSLSKQVPHIIW